ncbi:MAG: hypothetical protein R2864_14600 [Syntrophotaleaceae bacterium]
MSAWKKSQPSTAFRCCSIAKHILTGALVSVLLALLPCSASTAAENARGAHKFPLEMDALMGALSDAREPSFVTAKSYPRTADYRFVRYDFVADQKHEDRRSITLPRQRSASFPTPRA